MTDKITVELDIEDARRFAGSGAPFGPASRLVAACKAALPPEWEEGTLAWVTQKDALDGKTTYRRLAERKGGLWVTESSYDSHLIESWITNVEVIRVLKDDEVAVKRGTSDGTADYRAVARNASQGGFYLAAALADRYADALEAEK